MFITVSITLFGFFLGTILGSLAKALSDRSLNKRSFFGRSYCPKCKNILRWYDLLPIFSYILLGGKCRYCKKSIGIEYLLVEILTGILVAFLFWQTFTYTLYPLREASPIPYTLLIPDLIFKIFFITILIILFLTDIKKMFIPDRVILPAIVIATIYIISFTILKVGLLYYSLSQNPIGQKLLPPYTDYFQRHAFYNFETLMWSILSALLIAGFFMLLIYVTSGKGMGGGDVKLGAFIGLALGSPNSFLAIVLSFVLGALVSIILIITGKKRFGAHIAFGPFLVAGSLIALFWGKKIMEWYLQLSP